MKSIVMNGVKKGRRRHGEERPDGWSQKWTIWKNVKMTKKR